jgi:hypothetical protein
MSFLIDVILQVCVSIVSMVVEHIVLTSCSPSAVNMYIIYITARLKPVVEMQFNKKGHTKKELKCQKLHVIWKEEVGIL